MRNALAALWCLVALSLGCTAPDLPSGQCRYDSDCAEGTKCVDLFCRVECDARHPCAAGQRCISRGEGVSGICVVELPARQVCRYTSDCPTGAFCTRDGVCQAQCVTDYDCQVINPFHTCDTTQGVCTLDCTPATGNCDDDATNGCEVALARSPSHCGACGRACAAGQLCVDGACACPAGQTLCAGACVDTRSNPSHCGACGNACTTGAVCAAGACGAVPCPTGQTRCAGVCVSTLDDLAHCGGCGRACDTAHAEPVCRAGQCGHLECERRFGDCDESPANGCETSLVQTAHCGACGNDCAAPSRHVLLGACVEDGSVFCTYKGCAPGWFDGNEDQSDGCEARTEA